MAETYGVPIQVLGKGTYGTVIMTDKGYAVKLMKRKLIEEEMDYDDKTVSIRELSNSEINSMVYPLALDHPGIIKYHNISIGTEDISIVMDAYENDIWSGLRQDPGMFKPIHIFRSLCTQMVSALAYLTSRDIIHGDIKSANILYRKISDSAYTFVLADFDLAHDRVCYQTSIRHTNMYTPGYRPPEMLLDEEHRYSSDKSDVWALGVTFAFTYSGDLPYLDMDGIKDHLAYERDGDLSSLFPAWSSPLQPLVADNPEVETFVRRMVRFEPKSRASIFELQSDPFLDGTGDKIPHIPCYQRIGAFDRKFNFTVIEQTEELKAYWHKVTRWMLVIQEEYSRVLTPNMFIMAVELMGRYMIAGGSGEGNLQSIGCSALYLAAVFFGITIESILLSSFTNYTFPAEKVVDLAIEILIVLKYDLCAKTDYDEIFRYTGIRDQKILDLAGNLLKLSYIQMELFANPNNSRIVLYLAAKHYKKQVFVTNPTIEAEIAEWQLEFLGSWKSSDVEYLPEGGRETMIKMIETWSGSAA